MRFDPGAIVLTVIVLILSLTVHEASHALTAYSLGDPTAKNLGRLSLNPIRHLDPLGTIFLVFMVFAGFGIGWAKPVPINPYNMRTSPRTGAAIVSLAGPVSNMLIAAIVFLFVQTSGMPDAELVARFLSVLFTVNVALAAFNLIPIPPLDGFGVLLGVLPRATAQSLSRIVPFAPALLLLFLMFPTLLSAVLNPLRTVILTIVTFGQLG